MNNVIELQKFGISQQEFYNIGTFLLSLPIVKASLHTALSVGFAAVKTLVASVIAIVMSHFLLVLTAIAVTALIVALTYWIIEKYK